MLPRYIVVKEGVCPQSHQAVGIPHSNPSSVQQAVLSGGKFY